MSGRVEAAATVKAAEAALAIETEPVTWPRRMQVAGAIWPLRGRRGRKGGTLRPGGATAGFGAEAEGRAPLRTTSDNAEAAEAAEAAPRAA